MTNIALIFIAGCIAYALRKPSDQVNIRKDMPEKEEYAPRKKADELTPRDTDKT